MHTRNNRHLILILTLAVACVTAVSSRAPARQNIHDAIPRNRLVSDAEFLRALDLESKAFNSVRSFLLKGDTSQALEAAAKYFRDRSQPRHYFPPAEFPRRLKQFVEAYPTAARKIVSEANSFIRTYGEDVDWMVPGKDRRGRAHTPNTVRFLARQWQAENIALSYYIEGKKQSYLDFLIRHIHDFVRDYETGRTESGGNDVFERFYAGHRARNWLAMHHILLSSPQYSWQDQIFMIKVFLLHGARLMDVCERFNWGNHQLVGLTGIFEISTLYPEFPVVREWNRKSLKTIMEHLRKEIPQDGFQCERASHYFKLDILNYYRIRKIAALNGRSLPPPFEERFRAMFDALVAVAMPSRRVPVLQDGQATYQQSSNDMAELPEPTEEEYLSLGAALYREPTFRFFGGEKFPPSLFWYVSDDEVRGYETLRPKEPEVLSLALPQTHYYVMRTGWKKDDLYMLIDAGLAADKPDHTHGGVLGVIAYAYGSEILPSYPVRYSDPNYRVMKNSLVKNIALVDTILQGRGWIENKARTGFGRWQVLPVPSEQEWLPGSGVDFMSAQHNGFEEAGVQYRRSVIFIKPEFWIVVDDFAATSPHLYRQIWQGKYVTGSGTRSVTKKETGGAQLKIIQLQDDEFEIRQQAVASTSGIVFEKRHPGSYRFTTLLLPSRGPRDLDEKITRSSNGNASTTTIVIGNSRWIVTQSDGTAIDLDGIATDAEMLVQLRTNKLPARWIHGAHFFAEGDREIRFAGRSSFEIAISPGGTSTLTVLRCSNDSVGIKLKDGQWHFRPVVPGKSMPL